MPSSFTPTPAETTLVHQVFQHADPQKLGVVTGDAAVKVFDGAKLPPAVLAEIWSMADDENNGWLSKKGVAKAVRMIGWAQAGRKVTEELLEKPGPPAKIEGINNIAQHSTGMSLPQSPMPHFPVLTPQDREKYTNIFRRAGPVNGLLSGEKARDIFLKSKLPNDQLLQIWNLADTQDRGALDQADFAIGMYFINGLMSKTITFIPSSLPPGLYQQAGGAVVSHLSGNSAQFSPQHSSFSIQPQTTGQRSQMMQPNHTGMSGSSIPSRPAPALPARPSALASPFQTPSQPPSLPWDVTPAEKANFDTWFDNLDTQKVGFIEGDVAVPFMLQSGLPGEVLATVWDLSDLNNDGRLTRDCFAVAMHLIQKKLAGVEIPAQLPQSLIPPSMRTRLAQQPQAPLASEPVRDLFSFDDSPPPSAVSPQATGVFPPPLQPQQTGTMSALSAQRTGAKSPQPDPFRQPIAPSYTGSATNFLDDDEPAPPAQPFQDKSAEIGNTKNQLNSTTMSLEAAKAERRNLEDKLAEQSQQLQSLQMQLSTAKAAYEGESNTLATLKDRHSAQQAEITKTREELIRAESDLSALKVERAEIEGAFLRDKEDARELHRRMIETGKEADAIKVEVEKLKKDAKQQKGLLAIAKKQLSSKEADKAKAQKELEEATAELNSITKEQGEVDAALANLDATPAPAFSPSTSSVPSHTSPVQAPVERVGSPVDSLNFAAAQPLPLTPDVTAGSPVPSIRSNNPFDRLKSGGSPRSQSPFAAFPSPSAVLEADSQPLGDDIFDTEPFDQAKPESAEGLPYDSPEPTKSATLEAPNGQSAHDDSPLSPNTANETEFFHTPPTSANLSLSPEPSKFSAMDDFASTFALDEPAKAPKTDKAETKDKEDNPAPVNTDFDATFSFDDGNQGKELEIEESDSDSEDEDEVPLSQVRQSVIMAQQERAASPGNAPERVTSFDDVFGGEAPSGGVAKKPEVAQTETNFDDIFGSPGPQTNGTALAASPAPVAGVDAFDEALGRLSPSISSAPATQPFSFDSTFDDNFDFAAAKEEQVPLAADPASAAITGLPSASSNFDDMFTTSGLNGQSVPANPQQAQATGSATPNVNISFDDAFSNDLASTLNAPAAAQSSPAPIPTTVPPFHSPPTNGSINPFPSASPATSPSAIAVPRPSSAHRAASPFQADRIVPQRTGSPKPRLSSSSSKEGSSEKAKENPPRHSKISLRLPFGRKKKQQTQQLEPMPTLPTHLSPTPEQIERTPTPATDDDVEPVKQLTAMGFSRGQAVAALEKYGYDVQRALNSLLAGA